MFLQEWETPYGTAPFSKITEGMYLPAVKEGIRRQKEEIEEILASAEEPTFENTVAAYERSGKLLAKVTGVFYNLSESDSTPKMRNRLPR